MKIRKLKLFTTKLELEKTFYTQTLGFEIIDSDSNSFTLKIGWSELTFEKTEKDHKYHYCFLIPSNKLNQALEWMEKRIPIIDIENDRKTQRFESWKAVSFYFHDASGNIAEFIVREELDNGITTDFKISDVLCINEIGMPTNNIQNTNNELRENFGTEFWKGDLERFATNGTQEGMFLLPNCEIKDIWFPSSTIKIKPEPFEVLIENNSTTYSMKYKNGQIITPSNNSQKT